MSNIQYLAPTEALPQTQEPCYCVPLGTFALADLAEGEDWAKWEGAVPIAPALNILLQDALEPSNCPYLLDSTDLALVRCKFPDTTPRLWK